MESIDKHMIGALELMCNLSRCEADAQQRWRREGTDGGLESEQHARFIFPFSIDFPCVFFWNILDLLGRRLPIC